jgi:hypothetical protein
MTERVAQFLATLVLKGMELLEKGKLCPLLEADRLSHLAKPPIKRLQLEAQLVTFVNHLALHGIFLLKARVVEIKEAASVPAALYGTDLRIPPRQRFIVIS